MKCINLDWLEVYLHEAEKYPLGVNYFERWGYKVAKRDYGTPQYSEMFTIFNAYNFPMYEIRRAPYSTKDNKGIFDKDACHLRLTNRQCYSPMAIDDLRKFLTTHGYQFSGITRCDICCDFNRFDNGDYPADFVREYMANKYHKIGNSRVHVFGSDYNKRELIAIGDNGKKILHNPKIYHQGHELTAHGEDGQCVKHFNSLKWGSPSSRISTKLYNKSKELAECGMKFHIIDNWEAAGLDKNNVWRLEFSISSDAKTWVSNDGEFFKFGLENIESPDKLAWLWNVLCSKYFVFTKLAYTRRGTIQRKDRSPAYLPFNLTDVEPYKPISLPVQSEPNRTDKLLIKKLRAIIQDTTKPLDVRQSAQRLIGYYATHHRTDPTGSGQLFANP